MNKTRLSSNGQVIIPKSSRESHHSEASQELVVIDTQEGVLLKPAPPAAPATLEELAGCFVTPDQPNPLKKWNRLSNVAQIKSGMSRMISIDTNVLVRLLTGDNKEQAAKAKHLFAGEHIYITKTVILETEWVLRYAYGFKAVDIAGAFMKLLGQQNVLAEDAHDIALATSLLQNGMDFADAQHLVCSQNYELTTFDRKLKTKATDAGLETVRLL